MSPSSYAATRIRFDNAIEVVTSARLQGRAIGGVADTLRLRAQFPDSYCDDALESYRAAETRARAVPDQFESGGLNEAATAARTSRFCEGLLPERMWMLKPIPQTGVADGPVEPSSPPHYRGHDRP